MNRFPASAFAELETVYRALDEDLARIRPLCRQSGVCCNFAKAGHRLYATDLEMQYLAAHETPPATPVSDDVCPYLTDNKCGVRDHRMLGCRIYFCDPSYEDKSQDLYEAHLRSIKEIYARHGVGWQYGPAMAQLRERAADVS